MKLLFALGTLLAVPLIAYGILRAHLFDIDLRIRWTIKQSTVAAVFVAVFYLVAEISFCCWIWNPLCPERVHVHLVVPPQFNIFEAGATHEDVVGNVPAKDGLETYGPIA